MKILKRILSVFLAIIICLAVFPGTMKIKSSAVKYAYSGKLETGVTGTHLWPNNCLGATSVKALGANEVSTPLFTYDTNKEGTGQMDTREMSDSDAPIATYYVDANDAEYTVTLLCKMTDDKYAQLINCQFTASNDTKSKCSISDVGWDTQWYFKQNNEVKGKSKDIEFTGKTPSAAGEQVEYMLYFLTDIQNSPRSGYIHAVYKLKIRFVAFGGSDSGKITVSNHILRNWTDLYCYDAVMSAYNVDGGTNGEYINTADGKYAKSDSDFPLKSIATAFAYIDRSVYSKLEDTNISFSHKVASLCANGKNGWSWAGIRISSDNGSFESSIGPIDYTIDNSKGNSYLKDVYNLPFKVCGDLPNAGEDVNITVAGYYNANATQTGFHYNACTNLVLTLYLYDKTELNSKIREAAGYFYSESLYSADSFTNFESAYDAAKTVSDSQTVKQSEIESAKTNLINAINALERVQTVTFDSQSATTTGTTSVFAIIGKAMPAITLPSREHYSFNGYYTQPNGEGVQYYNADGSSARNFDLENNVTLYASWSIDTFDIKFVNYDGSVLRSSKAAYNTTPVYGGDTPIKKSDADNEYRFIGWDPEIKPVTGDAIYTAKFEPVAHTFKYVSIDSKQHKLVCDRCKYEGAVSDHTIVKDEKTGCYKCTECDYCVAKYSVKVNGTEVPLTLRPEMTTEFLVATITYQNAAKPNKDGKYFVYWKDADTGEIISAYTTYSFFVTRNYNIVPVFATQQEYYTKRAEATVVARMTGIKDNENGSYSLLAEHSVSSSAGPINNHGILYTYDASLKDSLDMDNIDTDGISRATANSTSTTLTGLFNVKLSKDKHSAIYARPYICFVDNAGKITYKYGEVKEYSLADISTQAAESDVLSTDSYDLSDISVEEPVAPTEPTEKNPLEKIADFFAKLVEIIKTILSFFGLTGVAR